MEVLRRGRRVYARMSEGGRFFAGKDPEGEIPEARLAPGLDITGRGVPNLVVFEFTGGAHCCFTALVFEIGETFRRVADIEGQHGVPIFEDLDGDGRLEDVVRDWTFACWNAPLADFPAPRAVLQFRQGG